MAKRVCPWWLGYFLASPVRRWISDDPAEVIGPYVREGMTVLEPGPGMGYFTLELARRVGPGGRVIAPDIQPRMIAGLKRRAAKAGLLDRIETRLASPDSLEIEDLAGKIDFTLAFALVHEMPSAAGFFAEASQASKPGATVLFAEPRGHVNEQQFAAEVRDAINAGFAVVEHPKVRRSRAVLLVRTETPA